MNSDLHPQADAYVLNGLTSSETAAFETHLETCAACRAEVAALRQVTAQLSEAVATPPPATLRSAVLAQIATTPQDATATAVSPPSQNRLGAREPGVQHRHRRTRETGDAGRSTVVALRPSRRSRGGALLAAASVLAALGFGGWALDGRQDAQRDARDSQASAGAAIEQTQQLTSLLASPDVKTVPGSFARGGQGAVVYSQTAGSALLVADQLPALPADKVYEAWTVTKHPVPAGTFDAAGNTTVELPDAALDAASIAVTVEPRGGSDKPSGDPIFTVKL